MSDLVDEFFKYLDEYADLRYMGQSESDKKYLKIGLAIMMGHMLRKEKGDIRHTGRSITTQAVRYFPTGFSSLDARLEKDYFTDHYLHSLLVQDPGNYEGKKLVLDPGEGLLTNMAILYWYWRKSGDLKAFKDLRQEWQNSGHAPDIIIKLLNHITQLSS
ncbi:MAG: hypothetical protein ACFFCZ_21970 [Promethearchaeota archaeon]